MGNTVLSIKGTRQQQPEFFLMFSNSPSFVNEQFSNMTSLSLCF